VTGLAPHGFVFEFSLNALDLVSFLFSLLFQPFSELLQHVTGDLSVRAASCLQCAKNPLKRAFGMADLADFVLDGHEVVLSYIDILY
jgi:hypothetical protein